MTMRTRAGLPLGSALVCVLLVTGCGDDGPDRAGGPGGRTPATSSPAATTTSPTAPSGAPVEFTLVALLSATNGGGRVSTAAVPVPDAAAARRFAARLDGSALAARVVGAVEAARVPEGRALYAAVVAQGCSPPRDVEVARTADGFAIEPTGDPGPDVQCLAAVTTVALVAIAT